MIESDVQRFIREEIKRQLNVVLSGQSGDNADVETETIDNMYPGMPSITKRPVMHPFGFASRAPKKTISVTAKQGAEPTNRMVLGHRDSLRPKDLGEGDSVIYSSDGKSVLAFVKLLKDEISFSTGGGKGIVGKLTKDGKVSLANQVGELIAVTSKIMDDINQLMLDVQSGLVTTILGPEPLVMPTFAVDLATLAEDKIKFDTFKA